MTDKAEKEYRTEDEFAPPYAPFIVFFYGDRVFINETEYPIGQCMVDVLNLDETLLV